MSVNDKTENRGTHGVSSSMLDTLVSSSENPLSLDMGSVKKLPPRISRSRSRMLLMRSSPTGFPGFPNRDGKRFHTISICC